jgi:NitT/TauT family transport system ATP-binding protein
VVRLVGVSKVYGRKGAMIAALDSVDLAVWPGELVCLVGASGCGKSTLLSLVAGLDRVTAGHIQLAAGARPALMFQEPALFPWLTVLDNVALPLRLGGIGREARRSVAHQLLTTVALAEFGKHRPHQLSGGMRQRVALARTLALAGTQDGTAPVLLMDEPFGALDAMTRDLLHDELERIWLQRQLSILFVTHNVREAVRLADRIVLLTSRPGRVADEWSIDIARPRRIDSPEVAVTAAEITGRLRAEVSRHGG